MTIIDSIKLREGALTNGGPGTSARAGCRRQRLHGLQAHSVAAGAVFAGTMQRAAICDAARKLSIGFVGLFLVTDLATRLNRDGRREADASDATPEIAGLQEKYSIGTVDWAVIDASGTPGQTLKQCQTRIAH